MKSFLTIFFLAVLIQTSTANQCGSPANVCAWKEKIVGIKTPNMIASGIVLSDGFILTNRHVIEDHEYVLIRYSGGNVIKASYLPHNVPADLAILRPQNLQGNPSPILNLTDKKPNILYVVAFDQGRSEPRVYKPSTFAHHPDVYMFPQARIHSNTKALPGNSGGAVVDEGGNWIGILASGDGKISEIIPATHAATIALNINDQYKTEFKHIGQAIRICADTLFASHSIMKDPPKKIISKIEKHCSLSQNKQLLDQAGQAFGRWWLFKKSEIFLKKSQTLDPNSPNTLMSLAVTYHLSRAWEKERNILKKYLEIDPSNAQALRLGAQVAGMLKDQNLANDVLELMEIHNPAAVPLARSFIDKALNGQNP